MSTSVEQAFVKQFERDTHEAYQRTGSKLRTIVRTQEPSCARPCALKDKVMAGFGMLSDADIPDDDQFPPFLCPRRADGIRPSPAFGTGRRGMGGRGWRRWWRGVCPPNPCAWTVSNGLPEGLFISLEKTDA